MQNAIRAQNKIVNLEDQKLALNLEVGIFITMNPGYSGRVELPVALKNIFRPVQMVMPDWQLVTESLLSASGFEKSHQIAQKITYIQKFASDIMQRHAQVQRDFGLRAIRAIIN